MTAKQFSDSEIQEAIHVCYNFSNYGIDFAGIGNVIEYLQSRVKELEGELLAEKEFRLKDLDERTDEKALHHKQIKDHKEQIQTLERERDSLKANLYTAMQFGYCHADIKWLDRMGIMGSSAYRDKVESSFFKEQNGASDIQSISPDN